MPRNPYGLHEPRALPGGKWRVQVPIGRDPATGRPRFRWFTRDTKAAARRARDEFLADREKGVTPPKDTLTVATFLVFWLEATAASVRPRTHQGYARIVENHLVPGLGRRPLRRLDPFEVGRFYADLSRRLTPGTVRNVHAVLRQALNWAVRKRLLPVNVAALADLPAAPAYEARVLSPDEARALLTAARGHRLAPLLRLALYTGLREGELLGLRWRDVDLEAGVAHVRQAITRDKGKSIAGETKTHRSRRPVPLAPDLVQELRDHRALQAAERLIAHDWEDHDLVFPSRRGTPITPTNLLRRWFYPLVEQAGIPPPRPRFHDLRHTVGTHTFRSRPNPKAVSDLLGHARTSTTLDIYAGTVSEETRAAADEWAARLRGGGQTS